LETLALALVFATARVTFLFATLVFAFVPCCSPWNAPFSSLPLRLPRLIGARRWPRVHLLASDASAASQQSQQGMLQSARALQPLRDAVHRCDERRRTLAVLAADSRQRFSRSTCMRWMGSTYGLRRRIERCSVGSESSRPGAALHGQHVLDRRSNSRRIMARGARAPAARAGHRTRDAHVGLREHTSTSSSKVATNGQRDTSRRAGPARSAHSRR